MWALFVAVVLQSLLSSAAIAPLGSASSISAGLDSKRGPTSQPPAYIPQELCKCAGCLFHDKASNEAAAKKYHSFVSLADDDSSVIGEHVKDILEHNHKWVRETKQRDPDFFASLARGQSPKFLYFGCSDSRVPSSSILGLG